MIQQSATEDRLDEQSDVEHAAHKSRLYSNFVPAYRAVWPAIAGKRISDALQNLQFKSDSDVLEVGVGTGLSLAGYPTDINLVGVDLSEAMLKEAEDLIEKRNWNHVEVMPMNAEDLKFDNNSFDYVTSFHTISVVSDPKQMMSEIVRVCRPGGRIMIVNHFRSGNPMVARVVDSACSITKHLGWRTDLDLREVITDFPLQLDRRYKPNPMSLFTVITATCTKEA